MGPCHPAPRVVFDFLGNVGVSFPASGIAELGADCPWPREACAAGVPCWKAVWSAWKILLDGGSS